MLDLRPEIGTTISIPKPDFDLLLDNLRASGYNPIGPRVRDEALVYDTIERLSDLPLGYIGEQDAGHYRLFQTGHTHYFDVASGPQSWKQFLFPPRSTLLDLHRDGQWQVTEPAESKPSYAFIGVRPCELAAIEIQDRVFMRSDYVDPLYRDRRQNLFILTANCLNPGGTCFCVSMKTGPRATHGFDLGLTELDDVFVIEIGSELGRSMLTGLKVQPANAFVLQTAQKAIERAEQQMGRSMQTDDLHDLMLNHLESPHWAEVGQRCLSCTNCTQVCPTCFCWDTQDVSNLTGTDTQRVRVWDSCFNPGYSYLAGGNSRPTIRSRYRQWLTHKLGSWQGQFDTQGCVGCGRCITWCPVGIDITIEVAALRAEVSK
jgi:sulfhydrogenase subunit beta (sulfur reductase)